VNSTALMYIPIGVVVERRKAKSQWLDFVWRPISILAGKPAAAPWTPIGGGTESSIFYAGEALVELHRTEIANYRENLVSGTPALWVVLRPTASEPAYEIVTVTADPSEGEAFTDAGNDLVEAVRMPVAIIEQIDGFIAEHSEHHVERPFIKRQREQSIRMPMSQTVSCSAGGGRESRW
jgi:hypothetical protein